MEKYDVEVSEHGDVYYYKKGTDQLHRLDGPAIEYASGSKYWYQGGMYHRLDGPAIENVNGSKFWYQNGELHRLDGPAIEYADGSKYWYIEDVQYTEAQFNAEIASLNTKEMTIAEIEKLLGHKVKIIE